MCTFVTVSLIVMKRHMRRKQVGCTHVVVWNFYDRREDSNNGIEQHKRALLKNTSMFLENRIPQDGNNDVFICSQYGSYERLALWSRNPIAKKSSFLAEIDFSVFNFFDFIVCFFVIGFEIPLGGLLKF